MKKPVPYQILEMTESHTERVAEIHLRELPSSVLSRLGISFLRDFYYPGLVSTRGFRGYVILWENKLAGFISLSLEPEVVFRRLFLKNFKSLVMSLIRSLLNDLGVTLAIIEGVKFFIFGKRHFGQHEAEILSFAVPVRFRSKEFYSQSKLKPGNELFGFALDFLQKIGKKKTLLMVETQNSLARIFYRNMGMKETRHEKYFGLDCVKCEKIFEMVDFTTPVLLLESSINHLVVARQLGRQGVPVFGIDNDKKGLLFYSKYCQRLDIEFKSDSENQFIDSLINFAKSQPKKPLLYTGEDFIELIVSYKNTLSQYFRLMIPDGSVVNKILNKRHYYYAALEAGIPMPKTFFPETKVDIERISQDIQYPCIVKPEISRSGAFLYLFRRKVFKAHSKVDLLKIFGLMLKNNFPPLVQEIVQGPDNSVYQYCSYIAMDKTCVAEFTYKKLRQFPPHYGICTLAESVYEEELCQLGKKLLDHIGAWGISNTEFKRDQRDGKFKLIETNLRSFGTIALSTLCGIDLILASYFDLTEQSIPRFPEQRDGVKWINMLTDSCSAGYYFFGEDLTLKQWIDSVLGEKAFAVYAPDDLFPVWGFFRNVIFLFIKRKK